jgi:hypothetical protein
VNRELKIGITGGIGSGKSYVCKLLHARGITVYDCDAAAKRLMRTSPALQQQLCDLIGPDTYLLTLQNGLALSPPHNRGLLWDDGTMDVPGSEAAVRTPDWPGHLRQVSAAKEYLRSGSSSESSHNEITE